MKSFKEFMNEGSGKIDSIRVKIARYLNAVPEYEVCQGPYGCDPLLDYYASELTVGIDEIISYKDGILSVEVTTYFDEDEMDEKEAKSVYKDVLKNIEKIVGMKATEDKTIIWEEDPDGSGWEGYGTTILLKFDLKKLEQERINKELKKAERTSLIQILKNTKDVTDLAAFLLSPDFDKELADFRGKATVTHEEIQAAFS